MSTERHQLAEKKIRAAFPDAVEEVVDFRGERTLFVEMEQVEAVCRMLRDDEELRFNVLEDVVADDFFPEYPRFAVSYHLYSIPNRHRLRVRTWVEDPEDGPQTMAGVWPIATWLEMEVYDLMGVRFTGNNSLRRLFLPEDWQGHPLRKDYPLGYEEVQFSFNYKEVDSRKPYAKD
jgi:NADH-quinone oxidoreductase subunit C